MGRHDFEVERGREGADRLFGSVMAYSKDVEIYAETDPAQNWYEVRSGVVRTCRYLAGGHRQVTGFFFKGDVFGIDSPHRAAAESVTDVIIVRYARRTINLGVDAREDSAPLAARVFGQALTSAEDRIQLLGLRSAAERVAGFLTTMANYEQPDGYIRLPMSRNDIADYLAITPETVSRTLSQFCKSGLIGFRCPQRVRLLDWERLNRLSGEPAWRGRRGAAANLQRPKDAEFEKPRPSPA